MNPLNPMTVPLSERILIEASAGTGKTYTISLLYLRLLIDKALKVDQILVVTYTHAATDELRQRILLRLKEAVAAYENPDCAQQEYQDLLAQYPSNPERVLILKRALLNFDEAAIYTIHSFCQRALKEHAFDVGMPFESELIADEHELLLSLADSFWHRYLLNPDPLQAAVISRKGCTPDQLLKTVRGYIGRPYLDRQPEALLSAQAYATRFAQLATDWQTIKREWQRVGSGVIALLQEALANKFLNGTHYKKATLDKLPKLMGSVLAGERPKGWDAGCRLLTASKLAAATNKGCPPQAHPFCEQFEVVFEEELALTLALDQGYDQLCYDLMLWLREHLPQRKMYAGLLAFDDLLINLQTALQQRPSLARQLALNYPVALIDEFQDTDPVQYDVFNRIYAHSGPLVFVGDPKQAIYGFRGADIHTYLLASNSIEAEYHYTLALNFRSTPPLLKAFNTVFEQSRDPFRNQNSVTYEHVEAGKTALHYEAAQLQAPLRFWHWQPTAAELNTTQLEQAIAQSVASDIAALLMAAEQGEAWLEDNGSQRKLESRDIAILVRSHKQAKLISDALQVHHIASSQRSKEHIFATHEAHELRIVLDAIAEPNNESKLRRALTTELMGGTVQALLDLERSKETDNHLLETWVERFNRWHLLWAKQGFIVMFQDWLHAPCLLEPHLSQQQHILRFINGERRLTNITHLAELIHHEVRQAARGMQAILRWLLASAEQSDSDTNQLRLESDEALVQIVTIHKSKGLQYSIVYCPFLWHDSGNTAHDWFSYYDQENARSCLYASRFKDDTRDQAYAQYQSESQQEALRLVYVALTRAVFHCTVVVPTGKIKGFNYDGALYWLLYGHLPQSEVLLTTASSESAKKAKFTPEDRTQIFNQHLQALVKESQGCMAMQPLPEPNLGLKVRTLTITALKPARQFKTIPPRPKRIDSFSSLSRGTPIEAPDYDTEWGGVAFTASDFTQFPAGKLAGVCLHKLLERLDFTLDLQEPSQQELITSVLLEYGFDSQYQVAATQLLTQALNTSIMKSKTLCLNSIPKERRLDELEFYFPIQHLTVQALRDVLEQHIPVKRFEVRQAISRLQFQEVQGFMKGYIDLIFEANGRFHLVDYKSNRLEDEPSLYTQERMERAVGEAHYYLQYLIYCVALQRYLRSRLGASYSYEAHIGNVYYLFIRGMQPEHAGGTGIYATRPSQALIDALDALMG